MLLVLTSDEMHEFLPCTLGAFFAQRAAELRRKTNLAVMLRKAAAQAREARPSSLTMGVHPNSFGNLKATLQ
ncbi:hypothetical protein N9L19_00330 [bacterium]|nr:hypothetical protein [bacterium]